MDLYCVRYYYTRNNEAKVQCGENWPANSPQEAAQKVIDKFQDDLHTRWRVEIISVEKLLVL